MRKIWNSKTLGQTFHNLQPAVNRQPGFRRGACGAGFFARQAFLTVSGSAKCGFCIFEPFWDSKMHDGLLFLTSEISRKMRLCTPRRLRNLVCDLFPFTFEEFFIFSIFRPPACPTCPTLAANCIFDLQIRLSWNSPESFLMSPSYWQGKLFTTAGKHGSTSSEKCFLRAGHLAHRRSVIPLSWLLRAAQLAACSFEASHHPALQATNLMPAVNRTL